MKYRSLVKLSNIIGITSILLLVYWVFAFIAINVFGLHVFRENMTETFHLSILGILALMFGALIVNMMFNLTRIAEKNNGTEDPAGQKHSRKTGLLFVLSFPAILIILLGGNYLTSKAKEKMLIASAKSMIENTPEKLDRLSRYTFTHNWIAETNRALEIYSRTDTYFPEVIVIVADTIDHEQAFLHFSRSTYLRPDDTLSPSRTNFIFPSSKEERAYLQEVFDRGQNEVRFTAKDGHYELFYPFVRNGRRIVLRFSEYQQYGKIGS